MTQPKILIEQTAKKLKLIRAIGIVLVVIAVLIAAVMSDEYGPTTKGFIISGIIGGIGVITWFAGTLMSWWQHG